MTIEEPARQNFAAFIEDERARLHADRDRVIAQQRDLDDQLRALNQELAAIDAYESVKVGRAARIASRRRSSSPAPVARRGSKRDEVLSVVRAGDGLARGEILEKMGIKGDKTGEMSVSNALTALVKTSQVSRVGGKYVVPA